MRFGRGKMSTKLVYLNDDAFLVDWERFGEVWEANKNDTIKVVEWVEQHGTPLTSVLEEEARNLFDGIKFDNDRLLIWGRN